MYSRILKTPQNKSFFLFGPRGTGKTTWLKSTFPRAVYIDLLDSGIYYDLLAHPQHIERFIPKNFNDWVILDEVQRVPMLLNEVHRLIENQKISFILTGSSARKLKQKDVNLLAGRALTCHFYPLTTVELGGDFNLDHAINYGHLPATFSESDPRHYLESYVTTYLREEVQQEGLSRNLGTFSRFLEAASFSQGSVLNISEVARESSINRKVVENYFSILEDLMIAYMLPTFSKKAKRRLLAHPKFYFFDVGVYRTLRPMGPLDYTEEVEGISLETLVWQEIKAINDYLHFDYSLYYWRTALGEEVDFVLYGKKGLIGIEVKRSDRLTAKVFSGLRAFLKDYPMAKTYLLYGGEKRMREGEIEIVPVKDFLKDLAIILG